MDGEGQADRMQIRSHRKSFGYCVTMGVTLRRKNALGAPVCG